MNTTCAHAHPPIRLFYTLTMTYSCEQQLKLCVFDITL